MLVLFYILLGFLSADERGITVTPERCEVREMRGMKLLLAKSVVLKRVKFSPKRIALNGCL